MGRLIAAVEANCVPPGWKVVPIEPTKAMLKAAESAPNPAVYVDSISHMARVKINAQYKALIAAAPTPKEES